ncbi:MAG: peptidylprolyl isomerase [Pyrinomonadaceae bacterium]|nr:peptidylprolyl isomerase [Pyrinomonadaceae bacterium]
MASLSEYVALEVNGEKINLYDLLKLAKLEGKLQFIQDAVDVALIRKTAAERGFAVSDEELQRAADDFRATRELHDTAATEAWLAENHLSYVEWESLLEQQVLKTKLREALTESKVDQRFAEQGLLFDVAGISRLVAKTEDVAKELRAQLIEDGADFHSLTRQHSSDEATKHAGGYAGRVQRTALPAAVEAAVFGGKPGKVIGPVKTDEGWELIKIESLHPATLDVSLRETIKSQLFDEWLSERRSRARVKLHLLEDSMREQSDAKV